MPDVDEEVPGPEHREGADPLDDARAELAGRENLPVEVAEARARMLLTTLGLASTPTLPLAASIGLATLVDGDTYASLLQRADDALLKAKRAGRGRLVVA